MKMSRVREFAGQAASSSPAMAAVLDLGSQIDSNEESITSQQQGQKDE